jgi:hypothetical protein
VATSAAQAEVAVVAGWDHQLFPSYLVATATVRLPNDQAPEGDEQHFLGDRQGVLGVKVEAPEAGAAVKVTIVGNQILEESVFSGTLDEEGVVYTIMPRVKFNYDALARNKQTVPVSVTFQVEIGEEDPVEETVTLTLRSINDCPFTLIDGDHSTDVSFVFAAYVNEQHPFVDKVLREALSSGIVDSFSGYQSKDKGEVYRQVYALWNALSERDVRYSSITTEAAESQVVHSQHVRLIDESINNAQANCVDGSVLFASLLRKVNIEPVLIFVPGHCFLGFYADPEGKQLELLETTMIGATAGDKEPNVAELKKVVDQSWREKDSWKNFAAAIAIGRDEFKKSLEHIKAGKDPNYQVVPIAAIRRLGILPIAFDGESEYEAAPAAAPAEEN